MNIRPLKHIACSALLFHSLFLTNGFAASDNQSMVDVRIKAADGIVTKAVAPVTATFTDSQGRTTMYRYSFPDGMDTSQPQPLMIYFHGNSIKTQEEVLNLFFNAVQSAAHRQGLVAVMVSSPDTRSDGARKWNQDKDRLLIHEFLTQHLKTQFKPDLNRVYFVGASDGTCFTNAFLPTYGENYKGGYIPACGCHGNLSPAWAPSRDFVDNMKVFVISSKGDFQYRDSKTLYEYFKHTIGFETRADIQQSGGHCSGMWDKIDTGLDWMFGSKTIPEPGFVPHWERMNTENGPKYALMPNGHLIKAAYDEQSAKTTFYLSENQGKTWVKQGEFGQQVVQILVAHSALYIRIQDGGQEGVDQLFVSSDFGKTPKVVQSVSGRRIHSMVTDGAQLYVRPFSLQTGYISGLDAPFNHFEQLESGGKYLFVQQDVANIGAGTLLTGRSREYYVALRGSDTPKLIKQPQFVIDDADDSISSMSWDGKTAYAVILTSTRSYYYELHKTDDFGETWQRIRLPGYVWRSGLPDRRTAPTIAPISEGKILFHDSVRNSTMITADTSSRSNWVYLAGVSSHSTHILANDKDIYLTSDFGGLFKAVLVKSGEVFSDGFEAISAESQ